MGVLHEEHAAWSPSAGLSLELKQDRLGRLPARGRHDIQGGGQQAAPIAGIETMKLVDEAEIEVFAGNGGSRIGFRRESSFRSAPDGGDGGAGGSVYIRADENLNTLVDFRHERIFKAQRGENGMVCQPMARAAKTDHHRAGRHRGHQRCHR